MTMDADALLNLYRHVGKLITSSLSQEVVLQRLMQEIDTYFQPQNWSLLILDHEHQELFFQVTQGIAFDQVRDIRLGLGEGVAGAVAQKRQTMLVPDAQNDPRFSNKVDISSGFFTQSIIAVPVLFQDKVLGVIELINRENQLAFTQTDQFILESIADFTAIALTNAAHLQAMKHLAERDALTGVYNRQKLEQLIAQWQTTENRRQADYATVCIYLIDLNNFKTVNDTLGHQAGDQVLQQTAAGLSALLRDTDGVYRIGGDEFLLVCSPLRDEEVTTFIQDMDSRLDELSLRLNPARCFSFGAVAGRHVELAQLMAQADQAMYAHKQQSKTR